MIFFPTKQLHYFTQAVYFFRIRRNGFRRNGRTPLYIHTFTWFAFRADLTMSFWP